MLFLDTHVALWLYAEPALIPKGMRSEIDNAELEISFLHEIGRLTDDHEGVLGTLHRDVHLQVETDGWTRAAEIANHLSWTRDPFDRVITAHAICYNTPLCTQDRTIRNHYARAFWTA